jgi:hypothetical protein
MGKPSGGQALIVLDRTEVSGPLADVVRWRARQRSWRFALLVPALVNDELFGSEEADEALRRALPRLEKAAGGPMTPMAGIPDALLATERALVSDHYDEVIISTLPDRLPRRIGRDLPSRVRRLGVPVTVVRTSATRRPLHRMMQFGGA